MPTFRGFVLKPGFDTPKWLMFAVRAYRSPDGGLEELGLHEDLLRNSHPSGGGRYVASPHGCLAFLYVLGRPTVTWRKKGLAKSEFRFCGGGGHQARQSK